MSPALAGGFVTTTPAGKPKETSSSLLCTSLIGSVSRAHTRCALTRNHQTLSRGGREQRCDHCKDPAGTLSETGSPQRLWVGRSRGRRRDFGIRKGAEARRRRKGLRALKNGSINEQEKATQDSESKALECKHSLLMTCSCLFL